MNIQNPFSELDDLRPTFKTGLFGSDSEESIFKSPIKSKRLEDRLNLDEIDSVWCLEKENSAEKRSWLENNEKSRLGGHLENDDSIQAFNKKKSELDEGSVIRDCDPAATAQIPRFMIGKEMNLDFKHLKNLKFEDGVESPKGRPTDRFKAFVKKSKFQIRATNRVFSSRTQFGFGVMAKKRPVVKAVKVKPKSPNKLVNNFGLYVFDQVKKAQKVPESATKVHVNLGDIKRKSPHRQRQMRVMSTSRRRSAALFCERESGISTGLRRDDFVVAELIKGSRNKHTLINLTKLMERSPMPGHKQQELVSFLNSSLRKIESFRKIPTPKKPQTQSSLKKRGAKESGHFERLTKTEIKRTKNGSKTKTKGKTKTASKKKRHKGCKCRKTNCTRLHCVCFQSKGFCDDTCGCTDCFNRPEFSETIKQIQDFTQDVNPLAFKSKIEVFCLDSGQKIHNRGCSCTKNNCQKNYCECHKNGLACSPLCKCEGCLNEKVDMDVEEVKKVFKKCSRKKKKFQLFVNKQVPQIKQIQI